MTNSQLRAVAQPPFLGYAACALAACFWGTGFYFGKIILAEMSVPHMVLYRFLFAAIVLVPFALRHAPQLSRRQWCALLIAAFMGIPLQFLLQFWGLSLTTVAHASLMIGTMPVMLAVGATIFAHERLNGFGWVALVASTCGAALIILGGKQQSAAHGPSLWGDLLVVLSLMIALGWVLVNQRLMKSHGPLVITTYGVLSGTAMLVVWVLLQSGPPPTTTVSTKVWLAIAASGVLCTATTTFLWNWGVHHVPASRAGVFLNIEPALGSFLGVRLLGDKLGSFAWIGGALILGAAVVMTSQHHETNTTLQ